jgi:hypothetical protein
LLFSGLSFTRFGMQIYVGKSGQQLGPFSIEEINRKLADGTLAGTDLAWYEGAAGWAPLAGVAGVVVPPAAAPAPAPTPAPKPTPAPVVVTPAPVRPNASIVQPPRSRTKTLAVVSWVLLGATFVVSLIPFLGCGAWFLVWPVAVACIIMGIICLVRGGTAQGIFIILGAILIVPLCLFAPLVSIALFGGTVERKQETQIMENLRTIDTAKTKWVTETKASNGMPVTMANLTGQLGGKEVKPVVSETYDPMPVGQAPTATLPANTTLGPFSGGDILTAASVEKALAERSAFNWTTKSTPSPTVAPSTSPKPSAAPSVAASPKLSPSPSLTESPKPSVSPKSSAPPHSLISPRQSVEPDNSPSSRQSPSGKFAPRTAPRQSPSKPEPDAEKSGGLKQGKQYPGQSPGATPEKSPDDDE